MINNNSENIVRIGLLCLNSEVKKINIACSYISNFNGYDFFYFTPKDIDYKNKRIIGKHYNGKNWYTQEYEYPEMIYDRLRKRNDAIYNRLYQELDECVFNSRHKKIIDKLEQYDFFKNETYCIPYQKIQDKKDLREFFEKYKDIILKPNDDKECNGIIRIKNIDEINNLKEIEKTMVAQKYMNFRNKYEMPFDVRTHCIKHKGEWKIIKSFCKIGNVNNNTIIPMRLGGYLGDLEAITNKKISKQTNDIAIEVCKKFEKIAPECNELGVDLGICDEKIYLIEVNNRIPGILWREFEVAKYNIESLIDLYENKIIKYSSERENKKNDEYIYKIKKSEINKNKIDTILSFSGGIDSVYCLWDYIVKNPNKNIILNHVKLKYSGQNKRHMHELKACHDVIKWLDSNGFKNRYEYYESSFSYGTIPFANWDIVTTSYFTGVICKKYKNIKYFISSTNLNDAKDDDFERIKNFPKRKTRHDLIKLVAERNDIEAIFPIYK